MPFPAALPDDQMLITLWNARITEQMEGIWSPGAVRYSAALWFLAPHNIFYYKIFFIIKLLLPHYKNLETREKRKITYDPIIPIKSLFAFGALSTFLRGSPDVLNGPHVCSFLSPTSSEKDLQQLKYISSDRQLHIVSPKPTWPPVFRFLTSGFLSFIIQVETSAPS